MTAVDDETVIDETVEADDEAEGGPGDLGVEYRPLDEIAVADVNPRQHDVPALVSAIKRFGYMEPTILDDRTGRLVGGHGRLKALQRMRDRGDPCPTGVRPGDGRWEVAVVTGWSSRSDDHAIAALASLNRQAERASWEPIGYAEMLRGLDERSPYLLESAGYTPQDLNDLLAQVGDLPDYTPPGRGDWDGDRDGDRAPWDGPLGGSTSEPEVTTPPERRPSLADRFLIPPFDVLNSREGWWQDRKRAWIGLGIRSELGRSARAMGDDNWHLRPGGKGVDYRAAQQYTRDQEAGLVFGTASGRDPTYYQQKTDAEASAGRTLSTEEFEAEYYQPSSHFETGTSIFDPVLCELTYRWFSAPGMTVLDPFAGGSVRGLVAAMLGRRYLGNDLSAEQITANEAQRAAFRRRDLIDPDDITWTVGESGEWVQTLEPESADLIFTCPPYLWLEQYSDSPDDLSNLTEADFEHAYTAILTGAVKALRPNRFAVIVVGDVRDQKSGRLVDFRGMTVRAAEAAGLTLANAAMLLTQVGSAAVRAPRGFLATRVLARVHQDVLIFCKGDRSAAATACGTVDLAMPGLDIEDSAPALTPVEEHGGYLVKRDDLYVMAGQRGGKVRTCIHLAKGAVGLTTASSRRSPQAIIVAHVAQRLGIPARLHMPEGEDTPEMTAARAAGAEIVQHSPGHNVVIIARARDDAAERGWTSIPFGMECAEAVDQTAGQAAALVDTDATRIVVPVGSGMSLAGILAGMRQHGVDLPVLGVRVGADPTKRLDKYAPGWQDRVTMVTSEIDYHDPATITTLGTLDLDPIYEAKCLPFLEPGDLLWVVGIRPPTVAKGGYTRADAPDATGASEGAD